jgi:hypothetical protein
MLCSTESRAVKHGASRVAGWPKRWGVGYKKPRKSGDVVKFAMYGVIDPCSWRA